MVGRESLHSLILCYRMRTSRHHQEYNEGKLLNAVKFHTGGIPYLPVKEAWHVAGKEVSFSKGFGETFQTEAMNAKVRTQTLEMVECAEDSAFSEMPRDVSGEV